MLKHFTLLRTHQKAFRVHQENLPFFIFLCGFYKAVKNSFNVPHLFFLRVKMPLHMITQTINEKRASTIYVEGTTADISALTSLLEGSFEDFESTISGGTATTLPATFNKVSFKVDKPVVRSGRKVSCGAIFSVPHLNPAKNSDAVILAVIGSFDKNYVSAEACTTCKLTSDRLTA
ncbi:MAG: hypothetical protein RL154_463 [Pseudomonadota bacterium]|jgi:hypothetical protein